jgi:hypothetical protein
MRPRSSCPTCRQEIAAMMLTQHICPGVYPYDERLWKYWQKRRCAAKSKVDRLGQQVEWRLTYLDLCTLLQEAGITSADMSAHRSDGYVLARYNDIGHYEIGNCRFITLIENRMEQDEKHRGKRVSIGKKGKFSKASAARPRDARGRWI